MLGSIVLDSLIVDGCWIGKGMVIENSVIGLCVIIGDNVIICNLIVMGVDMWDLEFCDSLGGDWILFGIGDGLMIVGVIIDKNCCIGINVSIESLGEYENLDEWDFCFVCDGILIFVKDLIFFSGWNLWDFFWMCRLFEFFLIVVCVIVLVWWLWLIFLSFCFWLIWNFVDVFSFCGFRVWLFLNCY